MRRHYAVNSFWAIISTLLLYVSHVNAQNIFTGTWSPNNNLTDIYFSSDWANFTTRWAELETNGFRMHDYEVYFNGTNPVYLGVFRTGGDAHASWVTTNWEEFLSKVSEFGNGGLLLHDYESYEINGERWYAGIFRAGEGAQKIYISKNWTNFTITWSSLVNSGGYRMYDFETYIADGVREYVGIFRSGTGLEKSWFVPLEEVVDMWTDAAKSNLTTWDFEYFEDGNVTTYGFIFKQGSSPSSQRGLLGVDWEAFRSLNNDLINQSFALDDIEITPGACNATCTDQVLATPQDDYAYSITRTELHCEGLPHTCTVPGDPVAYKSPKVAQGGSQFVKMTTTLSIKQLFTLPFNISSDMYHNGWLYMPGSWHWAIDYVHATLTSVLTFDVHAAAPGTVLHVGWDWYAGNTVVISHDDGADVDRYRTIYMHLRDGAAQDCKNSWDTSASNLDLNASPEGRAIVGNFTNFLEATGCTRNGTGTPGSDYWGDLSDNIAVSPGDIVTRGQFIAKSGLTGPGGCNCINGAAQSFTPPLVNTHLHIFFARRDETDNQWYFFDPYGIYGPPECYPTWLNATGPSDTPCARYPVGWLDGVPQLPV